MERLFSVLNRLDCFFAYYAQRWQAKGWLSSGWQVTLPSEAEWEKGARGGLRLPGNERLLTVQGMAAITPPDEAGWMDNEWPQRRYPWGHEADPERANYKETAINDTSAAGCFPTGLTPYGCEEMSGNVWEWTRSLLGTNGQKPDYIYPYDQKDGREDIEAGNDTLRVIRGGSFGSSTDRCRCSSRSGSNPFYGDGVYGFRVVVSPSLSLAYGRSER